MASTLEISSTITNIGPSSSASPITVSQSPSSATIAAIVGGVLGGIVVTVAAVAMIVPCARRRQKRLRNPSDGDGPRVLRKTADSEASEPMMKGSWRDRGRLSEEDRMRSAAVGAQMEPGLIKALPLPSPSSQGLQPVMEDIVMGDQSTSHHYKHPSASYLPQPVTSAPGVRQSSRSVIPRFPSLDRLWPLTTAFRTSLYSSPSTRTKSSATSSLPSRSSRKHSSKRGRKGGTVSTTNPDALVYPATLGHEVGLGRGRASMDVEIKHARPANDVKYETAPKHQAFTLRNANIPPPGPSHAGLYNGYVQPQPQPQPQPQLQPQPQPLHPHPRTTLENTTRHQQSEGSDHRQHRRQKTTESRSHPTAYNQLQPTRHNRQNPPEFLVHTPHPNSHSQSRTEINGSTRKTQFDPKKARPSTARIYDHNGYPS